MEVGCIYCRIACKFKRRVSTIELLFVCVRQNRHFVCPFSECSSNCGFTAASRNTSGRVMMLILSILTRKVSKLKREPNGRMETIKWRQVQRIMKKICFSTEPTATPVNTSLRYDDAVLAASDALCATAEEQEQKILLARCGKWHPLALITEDRLSTFHMLAGAQTVSQILTAQPKENFECRLPCISQQNLQLEQHDNGQLLTPYLAK